ncbi:hypothetical protein ATCC90586_008957 [Pythium insidiosum]|nr:hypothetical protein ATCC90586_008957 [Pythium insidiosum]
MFEAEIARACAQITKQSATLPPSFRDCSVCLSTNAHTQLARCGHTFHSKCFLRWFRSNRSCPLCRGPVDKVQLAAPAPVVGQDALEALMAEMDDENDPLMAFLGAPDDVDDVFADADMEMVPLEDVMAVDDNDCSAHAQPPAATMHEAPVPLAPLPAPLPLAPTFAPTSTMPNYWNVLHQGLAMPSVGPPAPAPQPQRMVHIAPKPDRSVLRPAAPAPAPAPTSVPPTPLSLSMLAAPSATAAPSLAMPPRVVSCRCTGGCRNGRCACVKDGAMCGVSCRCTSCKNPFLMVKTAGADIDALLQDACFMHNVSKTRDMVQRLQEPVDVPCCGRQVKVLDCVQGLTCCQRAWDFSWCLNKLLDHERAPRNHCDICKRCCDHRDVHCHDCGRCYFAGVAASLPCPCKEASRKRRDLGPAPTDAAAAAGDVAMADDDEKEGECSIM